MHSADRIWILLLSLNVLSKPGGCVHFPPLSQNPQENQYIEKGWVWLKASGILIDGQTAHWFGLLAESLGVHSKEHMEDQLCSP